MVVVEAFAFKPALEGTHAFSQSPAQFGQAAMSEQEYHDTQYDQMTQAQAKHVRFLTSFPV